MLGVPYVSKITKKQFYTLNIDRITKPQKFNVKNINTAYETNKKLKILCNHVVPFAQILREKASKLMQAISDN